ncbi:uncharacterized protein CMU_010310 [Cryptosporidium muris RN66]|uniref:Uncharacterized protein n=1 Tax=Cryptosporidium muris (strain RN66) TaxID=441375 RepID=B6AE98_CRYMR|nr:uncharacterized protein CMU_010310 [Cryptosporidium muris RN66]EEA06539.1 hypothetical protein CMU_010310 [Cryptosporidium muris RN66]|eukprot:XP_002140888.1 hypothetical protein [Cryptosporidium muris RN66]
MVCKYICLFIYFIIIFDIYYSSGESLAEQRETVLDWIRFIINVDNSINLFSRDMVAVDPEEESDKEVIDKMLECVNEIYSHFDYFKATFQNFGFNLSINTMYKDQMSVTQYKDTISNIRDGKDNGYIHKEDCLNRLKNIRAEVTHIQMFINDNRYRPIKRILQYFIIFLECNYILVKNLSEKIEEAIKARNSLDVKSKLISKGTQSSDKSRRVRSNMSKEEYKKNQEEVNKLMSQFNLAEGEMHSDGSVRRKKGKKEKKKEKRKEKKKEKKKDNQRNSDHDNSEEDESDYLYTENKTSNIAIHSKDNKESGVHSYSELGATGFDPSYNKRGGDHTDSELGATGFDPSYNKRSGDHTDSELGATGFDPSYNKRGGDHTDSELGATGFDPSYNKRSGDHTDSELGATGFDPSYNKRGGDHTDSELGATGFDPSYNKRSGDHTDSELGATGFDPSYNKRGGDHTDSELGATGFDPSYNKRGGDHTDSELGATGFDPSYRRSIQSSVTTAPQQDVNLLFNKQKLEVEKRKRREERNTIIYEKKMEIKKYEELIVILEEEIEEIIVKKLAEIERCKKYIMSLKKEIKTIKLEFFDLYGIGDDIDLYRGEDDSTEESDKEEKSIKYVYPAVYV